MPVDMEHRPMVQDLHTRIEAHHEWETFTRARQPLWYGEMLTTLTLAIGGEPIRYLTASSAADGGRFKATLFVFTPSFVVAVEAAGELLANECEYSTTIRRRSDLIRYSITSDSSVFGSEAFDYWPGNVGAQLVYQDGAQLSIPLAEVRTSKYREEIGPLIESLRLDLTA